MRTLAGTIRKEHVNQEVTLKGWVQKRRDLGEIIFIDLRDRSGVVQIVFNAENSKESHAVGDSVRSEYVIEVKGKVVERDTDTINPKIDTGDIEIIVSEINVLNEAKTPPFTLTDDIDVSEDIRLKYRYLDLRREVMQETFKLRHQATQSIREFLNSESFLEMETPMLTKSTPEGARDYLVPSRVHEGYFYALPQSPQLFKQLLMVAGFEKYYQFARCFRDEDLRADRQPEFTQIDIETSFMTMDDILEMTERMMKKVMKKVKGLDIETPFQRMPYDEAMERFGSDKPDVRFEMELVNLSEVVKESGFKVFRQAVENNGKVSAINLKGKADHYSRKDLDNMTDFAKIYGAKGLAWLKVEEEALVGPIAKFFSEEEQAQFRSMLDANAGDILFFVADKKQIVYDALGALRLKLAKDHELINESKFEFLWITDWPLLEYDEEEDRYHAAHHPFTMPFESDLDKMDTDPGAVRAQAYDLVLNGYELGGGSLRIYQREMQNQMFEKLGFTKEEAESQFGFLLDALEYGAPPHGGIAFGFDRFIMLLAGRTNLRDTILFPKTASASDPMTDAPSPVDTKQLNELHLNLKEM
ncbi:aspartate--tRNA ligase [Gracilibacillus salitolerans]|uniref:Aspartate--tRNA ligase n=1 Tax=Gracilibacillus salitolerans TaxID=2663022 RepID=A0A5Q2TJG7_9BACI|nr:aspartate--tRNA ligase [Gracilibacillus salitolerans]QGH35069.1 aspartate--tRNA ligase [Gracilibacillus salitolerans]